MQISVQCVWTRGAGLDGWAVWKNIFAGGVITVQLHRRAQQQTLVTSRVPFSDRRSPKIHKPTPDQSVGATGLGALFYVIAGMVSITDPNDDRVRICVI